MFSVVVNEEALWEGPLNTENQPSVDRSGSRKGSQVCGENHLSDLAKS